jgi:hypothetical protein
MPISLPHASRAGKPHEKAARTAPNMANDAGGLIITIAPINSGKSALASKAK